MWLSTQRGNVFEACFTWDEVKTDTSARSGAMGSIVFIVWHSSGVLSWHSFMPAYIDWLEGARNTHEYQYETAIKPNEIPTDSKRVNQIWRARKPKQSSFHACPLTSRPNRYLWHFTPCKRISICINKQTLRVTSMIVSRF